MRDADFPDAEAWNEDSPDEPRDERLREFAERFEASRPALPAESLSRVGQSMRAEIRRIAVRRRAWLALSVGSLAAAILAAIALWAVPFGSSPQPDRNMAEVQPPAVPPVVESRFHVALKAASAPSAPAGPLLPLDDYRSLIEETTK